MTPNKWADTDERAFKRIAEILRNYKGHTELVAKTIAEAKAREIWKFKYSSFKEFCEKECGIHKSWAYELLKIQGNFLEYNETVRSPDSKSATSLANSSKKCPRPISGKTAKLQVAKSENSTRDYSDVYTTKPGKRNGYQEVDSMGFPIPEEAICYWSRKQEVQDLLTLVSKVRVTLEKAEAMEDMLYRGMSFNAALNESDVLYSRIKSAMPFAVCTDCKGLKSDDCKLCGGRGLINEFTWKHQLPEVKKAREKAIANA